MKVRVVGVDCATDDAKVGLAAGEFDGQRLRVEKATLCEQDKTTATTIIQRTLGKTPLDVGADRTARTAHGALEMLGNLGKAMRKPVPLAWSPNLSGISVIEVYPAATLTARNISARAYKKPLQVAERQKILQAMQDELDFDAACVGVKQSADVLDAVICLLAAKDFLQGNVVAPTDLARAEREGWIWAPLRRTR
jgi:hypothetical protein